MGVNNQCLADAVPIVPRPAGTTDVCSWALRIATLRPSFRPSTWHGAMMGKVVKGAPKTALIPPGRGMIAHQRASGPHEEGNNRCLADALPIAPRPAGTADAFSWALRIATLRLTLGPSTRRGAVMGKVVKGAPKTALIPPG